MLKLKKRKKTGYTREQWKQIFRAAAHECKMFAAASGLHGKAKLQAYRQCLSEKLSTHK